MSAKKPAVAPVRKRPKFSARHIDVNDSEVITRVYYDADNDILDAIFKKSGARYRYYDVTPKTFAQFVLAESLGRFFADKIRKRFDFDKIA